MINDDNPMHMIWHNDKCVQNHEWEMIRYCLPTFQCYASTFIQIHNPVVYVPKNMHVIFCTDGHKIGGVAPIVPALESPAGSAVSAFVTMCVHIMYTAHTGRIVRESRGK